MFSANYYGILCGKRKIIQLTRLGCVDEVDSRQWNGGHYVIRKVYSKMAEVKIDFFESFFYLNENYTAKDDFNFDFHEYWITVGMARNKPSGTETID